MAKKKRFQHRAIDVGDGTMVSLCETCKHMPSGKIPQSNSEVENGYPEKPHMYCREKAFFPDINYSNEGKPFYDVKKCDGYERYKEEGTKPQHHEIKRANTEGDGPEGAES